MKVSAAKPAQIPGGKSASVIRIGAGVGIAVGPWMPIERRKVVASLGGEPPEQVLIFPDPIWELSDMTLITDEESRRLVLEEFARRGLNIVVDYEHQTLEALGNGQPAPASGWIKDLRSDASGLWASSIEWTERAKEFIRAGEYRYFSPVAIIDLETRRVIALESVALTNLPRTNKQEPLTAKLAASIRSTYQVKAKESSMKWLDQMIYTLNLPYTTTPADLIVHLQKVIDALGSGETVAASAEFAATLPDDATILQACGFGAAAPETAKVEAAPAVDVVPASVLEVAGLEPGASVAKVCATILMLQNPTDVVPKAELEKVQARLAELDSTARAQRIDQLIASNRKKIPPALDAVIRARAEKDFKEAEAIVAELPEQFPTTQSVGTEPKEPAVIATTARYDGVERRVSATGAQIMARNEEIMREKGVSYVEANEMRKTEIATAR